MERKFCRNENSGRAGPSDGGSMASHDNMRASAFCRSSYAKILPAARKERILPSAYYGLSGHISGPCIAELRNEDRKRGNGKLDNNLFSGFCRNPWMDLSERTHLANRFFRAADVGIGCNNGTGIRYS